MIAPRYPEDFRQLCADGGFYYQHWHPDAPADFDGRWPMDQEPPPWSGGLWVYDDQDHPGAKVVVWEFGPELESGPFCIAEIGADVGSVQTCVDGVVAEVNRQKSFA